MNGCSFSQVLRQSFELVFVLTLEKAFSQRLFILNPTERDSSKNSARDFQNSPPFERQHVFMWQSVKILNDFNSLTLKQIFWKTKSFFKKLEYHFLVETKIENALFPYKSTISDANVKIKMVSTKWTYHKERRFASNYFFF